MFFAEQIRRDHKRGVETSLIASDLNPAILFYVILKQDVDMLTYIISRKPNLEVNLRCSRYETSPLHVAACKNNVQITEILLILGADVNAKNTMGHTPLFSAVANGKTEQVMLLLRYGADPSVLSQDQQAIVDAYTGRLIVSLQKQR